MDQHGSVSTGHTLMPEKEAKWVTHHALSVAFVCAALCIGGVYSAYQLPSSVFPRTDFPRVVILVDNGVMPSDEMMATITRPIEEAMKDIPGSESVKSATGRGSAEINVFFNWSVDWPGYLAPWVNDLAPGSGQQFMYAVGVVEIAAGLAVAIVPRIGAPLVSAWLFGIVVNLLTNDPPTYYDIALRDFGLLLGALALTRLAWAASARREPAAVRATAPPAAAIRV